jgi:hypothetical protein
LPLLRATAAALVLILVLMLVLVLVPRCTGGCHTMGARVALDLGWCGAEVVQARTCMISVRGATQDAACLLLTSDITLSVRP